MTYESEDTMNEDILLKSPEQRIAEAKEAKAAITTAMKDAVHELRGSKPGWVARRPLDITYDELTNSHDRGLWTQWLEAWALQNHLSVDVWFEPTGALQYARWHLVVKTK